MGVPSHRGSQGWRVVLITSTAAGILLATSAEAAPTPQPAPPRSVATITPTGLVPPMPDRHPAVALPSPDASPRPALPAPSQTALPRLGSITGSIHQDQPDGRPLERVPVSLTSAAGLRLTTRTDRDGTFEFGALWPGVYRVIVNPPRAYTVHGAGEFSVDLRHQPGSVLEIVLDPQLPQLADPPPVVDEPSWTPVDPFEPAHLAALVQAAELSTCGVPWPVLAAIARVESNFGRDMSPSTAGAIGYAQFLPTSWDAFGTGGDPYDYQAALPAMARYLCAAGASRDLRRALWAYNHAEWYVDLVLDVASQFDRLAPDGPSTAIVDATIKRSPLPLHYALAASGGPSLASASWVNLPFVGHGPGRSAAAAVREMLIQGLHATPNPAADTEQRAAAQPPDADLDRLVADTTAAGLRATDLNDALGRDQPWSLGDLRRHLASGLPVVLIARAMDLPGHADAMPGQVQPLLLVGLTPDGVRYNDPSFATSLGAGLAMTDSVLEAAWLERRAAAFAPLAREDTAAADQPSSPGGDQHLGPAPDRRDPRDVYAAPLRGDPAQLEPVATPTLTADPTDGQTAPPPMLAAPAVANASAVPPAVPAWREIGGLAAVLGVGGAILGWRRWRQLPRSPR